MCAAPVLRSSAHSRAGQGSGTDEAEARVLVVVLDDAPQRELRLVRHVVRLVEDHELRVLRREELLRRGKGADLLPHDVDAALVRRVQLQACPGARSKQAETEQCFHTHDPQ